MKFPIKTILLATVKTNCIDQDITDYLHKKPLSYTKNNFIKTISHEKTNIYLNDFADRIHNIMLKRTINNQQS